MKGISVSVVLVVNNLFKVGYRLGPLSVEQIHLSAQGVGGALGGSSQIGVVPFHRKLLYGFGKVFKHVAPYLFG